MFIHCTIKFQLCTWSHILILKMPKCLLKYSCISNKGFVLAMLPTASKVNFTCRSSRATNSHPSCVGHIKHYNSLEISRGHDVIPGEFHYDLLLINTCCLYFKVLLLCHTTSCYTNRKYYQYFCIYLNSNWLKCDLSHNAFLF